MYVSPQILNQDFRYFKLLLVFLDFFEINKAINFGDFTTTNLNRPHINDEKVVLMSHC